MMKERAWVRSWLSGFLLVVVLGHVQAQDNVEQLDITSFTLDTTLPTMTVKVCFTDTADSDLGNLDTSLVTLTCGSSADDPNQVILECTDTAAEIIPNYCSTHKFAKPFNAYEKTVYCLLDATDKTVDDSPPRSGSAEFEIPGQEAFPACTDAYTLVDQLLVGVVCSEVGSFDKVVLNSGKVTGNIKATTNVIYISHTDVASTVSFCTTIDNSASGTSGPLDICIPEMTIESTDTDFDTTASELTYTDSGATLTVTFPGTGTYDLVVMKGDSIENVDTVETEPTNTATTNIDIYNKGDGIHFVAVKKDDNSLTKADVTITDYNLRVMALTSYTLEMVWENKENANLFKIERTSADKTDTSFKTAHVNCTGLGSCFGYFVELIPDTEYTCSVSPNDEYFKITHQAVSTLSMTTGFSVRQLTLKWNSELNSADTSVCFDQEDATASDGSSYLELIMINSQGKILKSRRTTQTMQGILCFENILIETSTFSLSEGKVNVVVLKRDVNSHTVLTSGEAELFLISPEIKAVGARGGHISWDNPGGYSITTMMEGHSTHLAATTTGRLRHYFFPKKTEERLVVEADASGVKMTAVVPLTSTGAAESIVINEIVLKKQGNNVDICYEAIPTSPTVNRALITIIIIVSDSTANEINVAATISTDNCVTFADPALTVGDNIVLELQLYSSTDSSSLLGQGSIAFIMEDYQDLATCTSVSKFSDGMYRLVCEPVVKEGDNIMVDNKQMDILGSSDYEKNTHYVILKDVPTDAATLKVYRDISDVTVNDDTKGTVRVTRGTVTISDTPAPSDIFTSLTLAYETPRVEATHEATTSTNFDIVSYWTKDSTEGTYNVAACPDVDVAADPLSCDATGYTSGTSLVNVLLVGFTDPDTNTVLESDLQILQDYYITGSFVSSSIIEWQWTMEPQTKSPVSEYLATIIPEDDSDPSPTFITAEVTCDTSDIQCYVFFLGLTSTNHYAVMIQPKSGNDYDSLNQVISEKVTGGTSASRGLRVSSDQLRVEEVELDWRRDGVRVDVGVCFHYRDATVDDTGLTQYQLVLVDAEGRWRRVHGASHTREGRLCFSRVTLDSRQFNTAEEVTVLVIKRDVDGRTVLASGESHVFFITPKVEVVSAHVGLVSWDNPGGYTVSTRKESHPASVTDTTSGKLRHYFVPRRTGDKLVVKADASGVKIEAMVPLTRGEVTAEDIQSVIINEVIMNKEQPTSSFQICYEDVPSLSETVTLAEITVVKFDDTPQTTIVATTVDPCPTFDDPTITEGSRAVFELRLYAGEAGSYVQVGRSSLDFTMPGIKDLAKCSSGNKVGDGKMLRLSCDSAFKQDTDKITVADTQLQILKASEFTSDVQYLLLNNDLPNDGDLKVYREVSVTVNDSPESSTVSVTYGTVTFSVTPDTVTNVDTLTLEYGTPAKVEAKLVPSNSNKYDLVNYWSEGETAEVLVCPALEADALSCELTYTQGTSITNVLLVGYTDPNKMSESGVYLLQDYNIEGNFISSSTIEWQWTMEPTEPSLVSEYLATIQLDDSNSDPVPTFTTAKVTCDETDIFCYVYFLGLKDTNSYAVMIQPKLDSDYNNMNKIISEKVAAVAPPPQMTASTDKLMVEEVELDWRRDGVRVDVGVCFHYRDATMDDTGLTQYQLVLVDSKGRWRRVHGASHTREGRLCFSIVTLDSRQFNTAEEVTVLVIKRDVDGRTVLASGESHVFFIRGSVDSRGSSVSWNNPGNYTFTLYKEGQPHPLATSLTCHTCTHSLTTQALGEDLRSVLRLETQDSTVKLTARIPQDVSFTDMPGAITINYMTFPITKDNPSGASVSTLLNVKCDTAAAENSSFFLAFSVPESDGTSVHEYNDAVDVDKITVEPMNVTFENMQDYAFVPENDVTVFVTVQDSNRVTRDFGYAEVKLRDPEATSYRVGKKEDDSYEGLRITYSLSEDGDSRAQLGYDDLCKCDNSPCYCLGSASVTTDPQTLCLQLKTTNSEPTVGSLLQCTDDLQADDSTTMTTITGVKMTHLKDIDNVDVQVDVDSSNKVELLFYKARDTSLHVPGGTCDGTKQSCTMNYQFTNSDQVDYSVLVVTVESDQAVDSALLSFEDYKTTPQQLTSDVVEVRFSAKTDTSYRVDISPNGGAFDYTTLDCGGEESINCDVFFIMMTPGDYTAIVKQDQEGENNVVAADFTMVDAEEFFRNATLHHRVQGNETYLSVCVGGSFTSNTTSNYTLVIIYRENKNIMTTSALQETTCFPEVLLTLRTNQQVKVLILTDEKHRHVVRETDIYLLDPPSAGESISQVGSKTLKAIWNNRNQVEVKYLVGVAGEVQPVECPAGQECIQYIHLNSTTDKKNVTLEEHNQDTVQVVSFQIEPQTISQFPILDWSIRWDDHLRVCFSQPAGAASYELGLQKGVQHLETTSQAPIDTQDAVETCVLSTETIDVGAYIDLWMLVTAYDFDGNIIASGEHTWSAIFLSSGYRVQAAIKDSNIIATWHLIDDVSTIDNFNVILRSVDSESTVTVSSEMSTYVLNSVAPGTYAVCVNALKQLSKTESVQSEEVCSDILVVSDTIADVPHVEEVEPKSTAETSVLVTWQRPVSEDVSAFYVTWTNQSTPARRSLGSPRLPPQSLTRRYTGLQGAVPGVTGMGSGFTIVPAFYTSLEVTDLQQGAKYTFCVSSIKNDVVDQDSKCSVSDLGSFEKLDPPEDLRAHEKVLGWSGTETSTYLVEWFPNEKGRAGNEVVTGTTYTLNVTAGTWNISVRTVTSESSSDPRLNATHISGLISSPKQSGSKVVEVVWWEVPTPQADSAYVVTLEDGEMPSPQYTKVCSGDSRKNDCSLLFTLNVDTSKVTDINVSIQRSTLLGSSYFKLEPIEEVNPALSVRSANEVVVEWQKVDNAKYYIVSLYQDASLSNMRWRKQQTLPLRVTVQEDNLMGNYMTIQACVDSLHCGDIYQTSIMQNPGGDKNRGVVAGVVGGVLGAVLLAGIIFIVMKHKTVKRKERLEIKSVPREEEMTPRQNIFDYDEWGARRLGQPPVAQITVNVK